MADNVMIRGRLTQRGDGQGAGYVTLRLAFDDEWVTVLTDDNGYFSRVFYAAQGKHQLMVDVDASIFLDAAHFELADFDVEKRPLLLTLSAPSQLPDTEAELPITVEASSDGQPIALEAELFLGDSSGALTRIAALHTDSRGHAKLAIAQEQLGAAGHKRIEVRFAGDEALDAAKASHAFQITSSADLTLVLNKRGVDFGDIIELRGRLQDGRGEAVPGAVIALEVQSQRITNATTDERGDYRMRIDSEELGSGSIALQTIYRPTETWKAAARSRPATLEIGKRKPLPLSLALAAFAITTVGLLSFVGLRAKPWQRLRKTDADKEAPPQRAASALPPPTGLAPGRAKLSNTFRKAHYRDFQGIIRDTMNQHAVAMARITISGPSDEVLQTNAKGGFRSGDLHAGEHRVRIEADGFVSEEFTIAMPHKGEFHNTTIHMLPVREKIFALYKGALLHTLPDPDLWGIWTPRQILDHVRSLAPNEELARLTDFVEESFFSQRSPTEDVLPQAQELITAFQTT